MELLTKEKPKFNYSGHGWEGKNYEMGLSIKEIANRVRQGLKIQYPTCKFSVTIERYSGGQSMTVRLMSAPFNPFATVDMQACELLAWRQTHRTPEQIASAWQDTINSSHHSVNHYYIDDDLYLTAGAKEMFKFLNKFIQSYNFDDSDSMVDYFHTTFYSNISIGKWDKPFVIG